ncbi:MAG: GntR family transcriptional regulator [Syntrophomonadaceae bacterium]|nr:GntR family transcriptional regulator [Syntrophomonadaceae bacterium]MDD3024852.1 GntR family transcriptional regulator [Syntrophomonadaceae bacterium]
MDFDLARPIYQQIIDDFKKQMIRGELRKGERIPSQREYAEKARINPNTVQRAYREMENMRMVETLRGQGTYVNISEEDLQMLRKEMARALLRNFVLEMRALGFDDEETFIMLQAEQTGGEGDNKK